MDHVNKIFSIKLFWNLNLDNSYYYYFLLNHKTGIPIVSSNLSNRQLKWIHHNMSVVMNPF